MMPAPDQAEGAPAPADGAQAESALADEAPGCEAPANLAPAITARPGDGDVARVFRESSGRAVATLARVFGDIDLAEDAVQEAFAVAVERWPADGLPPNPGGWIVTTARRKALDRLRRES